MSKLQLKVPRHNFARARPTFSLAPLVAPKGVILVYVSVNPRTPRGGVVSTPPEVFLRCTPNYEADRAEILHSLWGILCATFGKKKLTRGQFHQRKTDGCNYFLVN